MAESRAQGGYNRSYTNGMRFVVGDAEEKRNEI
jgi:hypothetical protein